MRNDADSVCILTDSVPGVFFNGESQLCGKSNGSHHPQRIIDESLIGRQRSAQDFFGEIFQSIERIDHDTKPIAVQTNGQGIDGQITTLLIILNGAWFNLWLSRIGLIAFTTGPHEFQVPSVFQLNMGRTECFEETDRRARGIGLRHFLSQVQRIAHTDKIGILGWPAQYLVAYEPADQIGFQPQRLRRIRNAVQPNPFIRMELNFHERAKIQRGPSLGT